jgi:methionyl aminopeptidase
MQYNVERNGFSVVREFVGHGVGRSMHEDPKVPNFVPASSSAATSAEAGMTIAVEHHGRGGAARRERVAQTSGRW